MITDNKLLTIVVAVPILFNTSKGKAALQAFLKATKIGTLKWYQGI